MKTLEMLFPHLAADPYSKAVLQDQVGRCLRYVLPGHRNSRERADFIRQHGTIVVDRVWMVVGIQRNYKGDLCLRIKDVSNPNCFGRVLGGDVKVEFLDY